MQDEERKQTPDIIHPMKICKKYILQWGFYGIPVQPYRIARYSSRNIFRGKYTIDIHHQYKLIWFNRKYINTKRTAKEELKRIYRYIGTIERCPRAKVWWGDDEDE